MLWITSLSLALEAGHTESPTLHRWALLDSPTSDHQAFWCSCGTLTLPVTSSQFLLPFRCLAGTCHPLRPCRSHCPLSGEVSAAVSRKWLVGEYPCRDWWVSRVLVGPWSSVTMRLLCSLWKDPYVDREIFCGTRKANQNRDVRMDQVEAPATKHSDLVELARNQIQTEGENEPHKVVL